MDNLLNTEATARSIASEVIDGNNVIGNTANESRESAVFVSSSKLNL